MHVHTIDIPHACHFVWQVAHLYVVGAHRLACCEVVQHPTRPKQNEEGSASRGVLARTIVKSELHDRSDTSKPVVVDVLFAAQTTKRLRLQEGMSVRIFPPWLSVRVWQELLDEH